MGADAAAEGKEEEDEDDDGDEEEGTANGGVCVWEVGLDVPVRPDVAGLDELGCHVNHMAGQMVIWAVQMAWVHHDGAGYWGEEEVVGSHRRRAQCQNYACHNQQDFLTHQSGQDNVKVILKALCRPKGGSSGGYYENWGSFSHLVRGADTRLPKRLQVRKAAVANV